MQLRYNERYNELIYNARGSPGRTNRSCETVYFPSEDIGWASSVHLQWNPGFLNLQGERKLV